MDFFLSNPRIFFTPKTMALSMGKPHPTVKDCMNLLKRNSYLTKDKETESVYHITKENMEFWRTDFKNHVLALHKIRGGTKNG